MKVLITGATGFLGKAISRELLIRGHELIITSRDADKARESFPFPAQFVTWNPLAGPMASQSEEAMQALGTAEAVIHLTGEPVAARRWSDEQKKRILDSRILGTRHLWQSVAQLRDRGKSGTLKTLVAGSAIGFYGDREDTLLTESAAAGDGFLADVCKQWGKRDFPPWIRRNQASRSSHRRGFGAGGRSAG